MGIRKVDASIGARLKTGGREELDARKAREGERAWYEYLLIVSSSNRIEQNSLLYWIYDLYVDHLASDE